MKATISKKTKDQLDDKEITDAIINQFISGKGVSSHLIDVETIDGIVTLKGSTDNILGKESAAEIAKMIKGVRGIINEIVVNTPDIADIKLQDDISKALIIDPATDYYEIDVEVKDGIVYLSGTVQSWQEKELSEKIAKSVKGVRGINNKITIQYEKNRPDYEMLQDVKQSMRWDVRVDDDLIDVTVVNAQAILSGSVGSATEKSQAIADAWVTGIVSVNADKLEVDHWSQNEQLRRDKYVNISDEEIVKAIKDAYYIDPRLTYFDPEIKVENGIVILKGTVDNLKAKRTAEEDAMNVVGVWYVENKLKVRPKDMPDDSEISKNIQAALLWDPYVERHNISAVSLNGKVFLKGNVNSFFEKLHVEDIASRIKGVIEIENNIIVEGKKNINDYSTVYPIVESDWKIKRDLEKKLYWSPYIKTKDRIEIRILNGHVTLTGTVDTPNAKRYAAISAYESGAINVDNKLKVNYSPS